MRLPDVLRLTTAEAEAARQAEDWIVVQQFGSAMLLGAGILCAAVLLGCLIDLVWRGWTGRRR